MRDTKQERDYEVAEHAELDKLETEHRAVADGHRFGLVSDAVARCLEGHELELSDVELSDVERDALELLQQAVHARSSQGLYLSGVTRKSYFNRALANLAPTLSEGQAMGAPQRMRMAFDELAMAAADTRESINQRILAEAERPQQRKKSKDEDTDGRDDEDDKDADGEGADL